MKTDCDEVCLQGIEFWSSVCEEEMDLSIELTEVRGFAVASVLAATRISYLYYSGVIKTSLQSSEFVLLGLMD